MIRRRSGHIVVISSVQGKIAIPYRSSCKLSFLIQLKQTNTQDVFQSVLLVGDEAGISGFVCGQMQPLNTPPRPTLTVYGQRSTATGLQ